MESWWPLEITTSQERGISGSGLKWIAMITMVIDHFGAAILLPLLNLGNLDSFQHSIIFTIYTSMRLIGRLAFPIFCFLLVEGFLRTSSVAKYARRLIIFALISEIPFDLAISQQYFNNDFQNIFFTLLLGLLVMWLSSQSQNRWLAIISVIAASFLAEWLNTDYGAFGVLLIAVIYFWRENRLWQSIIGGVVVSWELTAFISFILTYYYNGERGRWNAKWLYWIYPIHLFIFGLIAKYFIL